MNGLFDQSPDATPIDPDECAGLRQASIATRADLNIAEQDNILKGTAWARRGRRKDLLSVVFLKQLHKQMFGDVWDWAGTYRTTNKNIGIEANRIPAELPQRLDDTIYQINNSVYCPDEIAVRLHHQLVYVHPFPNGNGRWSRLMADLVVEELGQPSFTWGRDSLKSISDIRAQYIEALRAADNHDIASLLVFARS